MILALFWPLLPWILQIVLFTYWGASAIHLASMGDAKGSLVTTANMTVNETASGERDIVRTEIDELTDRISCDPGVSG